ncbi:protein Rf1, mitochondrial isoform X3 [Brachypodium distachyon]|uniref:protein Rf1, mitochondrial isoform X3 n=1 Tax=Brachypodium distachyon TaxID=15368 RepID=UPI000D0DC072|nr:protein Rf1, mitochondrial isoform X3 [Brachypodium distachyon]|eukprot:XP_024313944.1 protein Rf1, mitochondrial isoform X3 [Brachypodium distachyon]
MAPISRLRRRSSSSPASPMSGLRIPRRQSSSSTTPMSGRRLFSSSSTPMPRLQLLPRRSSSSTSPTSRCWDPQVAFVAAIARVRAGTFSTDDAHHLFDELLRQGTPVHNPALNGFLAALARAPDSVSCSNGPALVLALFNRICREEAGPRVAPLSVHTYGILMDCCCRARRPDLGPAFFARLLRAGLRTRTIEANTFLKCLCHAKRTDEAVDVLLHRMSDLGCVPNAISYNTVIKSLCGDSRSQEALDMVQRMAKEGGRCSPDVVSFNTVIHGFFKQGEVSKACNLINEMVQKGVEPDVVTYNSIVDALCKARAMDKAELVLRQMVDKGVEPDGLTYTAIIHGYSCSGHWKESAKMFRKMTSKGLIPGTRSEARCSHLFNFNLCIL